jgi:hypothetical protein
MMKAPGSLGKLRRVLKLGLQLSTLPVARLTIRPQSDPGQTRAAYDHFTRPHPKYKLFRHKSMGMALIDLSAYPSPSAYLEALSDAGATARQSRKAEERGYELREIDHAGYRSGIEEIRIAADECQAPLLASVGDAHEGSRCYGAFDAGGRLVACCRIGLYGNFASADELVGYKNRDGVMYLVLSGIACRLIEEGAVDYFMCDSFLDAKAGQRKFKRRLGFRPYRVRYALD